MADVVFSIYTYLFGIIEFGINLIGIPLAALNLYLIRKTSVIHRNLKWILINQSACILVRALCRFIICLLKFGFLDPMAPEEMSSLNNIYSFSTLNRNFVAHVLIIERVMATLMVHHYEHRRGWRFTVSWFIVVSCISIYNTLDSPLRGLTNVLTNGALLGLGIVELAIFVQLLYYNQNAYKQWLLDNKWVQTLSQRYQLSENIRVGKQLVPTLILHLLSMMSSNLCILWIFFRLDGINYILIFTATFSSFCGFLIELTMIICHPFLKRDFKALLNQFSEIFRSNQIATEEQSESLALRDILNGRELVGPKSSAEDEHFELLKSIWDREK